ncbi:hypothetical protein [Nostoc sp.]|uniref:hypothetical protein n=1 Tax=Nostoc sp. TaxID=1180 RepID=UPI002FEEB10A
MQIKNLGSEKTTAENSDIIAIQQADGVTCHITRENFLGNVGGATSAQKYIQLSETFPSGSKGGSAPVNAWSARKLNTIKTDDTGTVVLDSSTGVFLLPAGIYYINATSNFYAVGEVKLRLQNITTNSTLLIGSNGYCSYNDNSYTDMQLRGRFTVASGESLALQYYCRVGGSIYNLGTTVQDGSSETWTIVDLSKIS